MDQKPDKTYLVIDAGGTFIKYAFMSPQGDIIKRDKVPTPADYEAFTELFRSLLTEHPVDGAQIALPGVYDKANDMVLTTPNISYLSGRSLLKDLGDVNGVPVFIENDANMAALGEYSKGFETAPDSMIFLTLGTGVGGGAVFGGKLLTGPISSSEFGHMTLVAQGKLCNCGNYGCFEKYCSISSIVDGYRESSGDHNATDALHVAQKADAGDAHALKVFDTFAIHLAQAIVSLVNIFNPDTVRIGGGLSELSEYYFSKTTTLVSKMAFPAFRNKAEISISSLKNDAALYGGVAWIEENMHSRQA